MKLSGPLPVQTFLERLPPLSPTLTLLLATLSREDVGFAKVAELIEQDPVLTGNVPGIGQLFLVRQARQSQFRPLRRFLARGKQAAQCRTQHVHHPHVEQSGRPGLLVHAEL